MDCFSDFFTDTGGHVGIGIEKNQDELIPSVPSGYVFSSDASGKDSGDCFQRFVA